jgi:hypothetical protein
LTKNYDLMVMTIPVAAGTALFLESSCTLDTTNAIILNIPFRTTACVAISDSTQHPGLLSESCIESLIRAIAWPVCKMTKEVEDRQPGLVPPEGGGARTVE